MWQPRHFRSLRRKGNKSRWLLQNETFAKEKSRPVLGKMRKMIRKDNVLEVEHLGGGKGTAYVHHIVSKEELLGHGRLYAKVVLPPGASVGWHQHVHDTEPYYILKGEADFIDNDKSVTKVGPGDCCIIEVGQYHSIENNSDSDVEFMALIYNEPGYLNDRD